MTVRRYLAVFATTASAMIYACLVYATRSYCLVPRIDLLFAFHASKSVSPMLFCVQALCAGAIADVFLENTIGMTPVSLIMTYTFGSKYCDSGVLYKIIPLALTILAVELFCSAELWIRYEVSNGLLKCVLIKTASTLALSQLSARFI